MCCFHVSRDGSSGQSARRSMQVPLHGVEPLCSCPRMHEVPDSLILANTVILHALKFLHSHRWERGYKCILIRFLISKAYCFFLTCKSHQPSFFCELFVFLSIFLFFKIMQYFDIFLKYKNLLSIRETRSLFGVCVCKNK